MRSFNFRHVISYLFVFTIYYLQQKLRSHNIEFVQLFHNFMDFISTYDHQTETIQVREEGQQLFIKVILLNKDNKSYQCVINTKQHNIKDYDHVFVDDQNYSIDLIHKILTIKANTHKGTAQIQTQMKRSIDEEIEDRIREIVEDKLSHNISHSINHSINSPLSLQRIQSKHEVNPKHINHKTSTYVLKAQVLNNEQELKIVLRTSYSGLGSSTVYQIELRNDILPQQVKKHLKNIEGIYNCLNNKEYSIDSTNGIIKFETEKWKSKISLMHSHKRDISNIQEQFQMLMKEFNAFKIQCRDLIDEKSQKIGNITNTNNVSSIYEAQIEAKTKEIKQIKEQLLDNKTQLQNSKIQLDNITRNSQAELCFIKQQHNKMSFIIENMEKQIKDISKENEKMKQELQEMVNQLQEVQNTDDIFKNPSNKFSIHNNFVQYEDNGPQHIFINNFIPFNQSFQISIKIMESKDMNIKIGIVKYHEQKNQQYSYSSGNAVSYIGWSGMICHGSYIDKKYKKQGKGFKENQVVIMNVNLSQKRISWSVGRSKRASITLDMLGQKNTRFVPFVQLYNKGDIIEVIK